MNRSKTNRLSCFEYTDLDTGFVITPEEYEKRYMTHLGVIRGQQEAMKKEILLKKQLLQEQQQQQQQQQCLPLNQQNSSSGSTKTHNTIVMTNQGNQMDALEKATLKIVAGNLSDSCYTLLVGCYSCSTAPPFPVSFLLLLHHSCPPSNIFSSIVQTLNQPATLVTKTSTWRMVATSWSPPRQ